MTNTATVIWKNTPHIHIWRGWSKSFLPHTGMVTQMMPLQWRHMSLFRLTTKETSKIRNTWWRHEMETFSALLAICAGNSPVPGEIPAQRPVKRSFDVYFDLCLNKRLSKQSWGWRFETSSCPLWRHRNVPGSDMENVFIFMSFHVFFVFFFRVMLLFVRTNLSDVASFIYKEHWIQKKKK